MNDSQFNLSSLFRTPRLTLHEVQMTGGDILLYFQILGSFDYLQLPPKDKDDPTSPLTIILYPDLEEDFADFVIAYSRKKDKDKPESKDKEVKSSDKEAKSSDKEAKYSETKKKLRTYCEYILHAKKYQYDMNVHHRISATTDDIQDAASIKFIKMTVKIGTFTEDVAMFPCFEDDDGANFLITTYGFNEDYAFIFKQKGRTSNPILFGMAEPTPIIDVTFRNRRHLEKVFAQLHRKGPPKANELCTLNTNQKIRLCSLVDNARSTLAEKVPRYFGARIKIQRITELNCEEKVEVIFHELDTDLTYQHLKSVEVTPFPCFITHYKKVIVDFMVSIDPGDKQSVFLLERIEHKKTGEVEVIVVGRVRQITLLKHADEFF